MNEHQSIAEPQPLQPANPGNTTLPGLGFLSRILFLFATVTFYPSGWWRCHFFPSLPLTLPYFHLFKLANEPGSWWLLFPSDPLCSRLHNFLEFHCRWLSGYCWPVTIQYQRILSGYSRIEIESGSASRLSKGKLGLSGNYNHLPFHWCLLFLFVWLEWKWNPINARH